MKTDSERNKKIRPALLLIDVQNTYLQYISQKDKDLAFYIINLLIDLFRKKGEPIIRIYHHNEEKGPRPGTDAFEYPPQINITAGDKQLIKTYSDSFNKTLLDHYLKENNVNTLFLCGLSAIGCVLATKTGAINHDYKAFIVRDSIMSHNSTYTKNVEIMFDSISYDAVELLIESI
jgi:nicotinamidase-related amidase